MAQVAEHVLGKDEVTSSNLVISSKKRTPCNGVSFFWSWAFATSLLGYISYCVSLRSTFAFA